MTETIIDRDGDLPIRFTGELLAEADSFEPAKLRWTEIALYRTSSGRYVLHEEGLSKIDGEADRSSAFVADDANELIDKLYRINAQGKRYITRMAQDLIAQAAIRDSEIAAACVVEV